MNNAASSRFPQPVPRILLECAWFMRGSRSLASLLPALLASGLLALVITAVTLIITGLPASGFVPAWMESWLVAWPIAFPLVWLGSHGGKRAAPRKGLALGDIDTISRRVTARQGKTVLRGLQSGSLPRHLAH